MSDQESKEENGYVCFNPLMGTFLHNLFVSRIIAEFPKPKCWTS